MPSEWKSIRIPCRVSPEMIIGDIYIRPRSGRSIHRNTLETRGWVLQETSLAPRTTYYGKVQLFWHCRRRFIREGRQANYSIAAARGDSKDFFQAETLDPWGRGGTHAYDDWMEVINDYVKRDLTFQSDNFPALSGVATKMRRPLNDIYHAGM
jgi:hypothetical protein